MSFLFSLCLWRFRMNCSWRCDTCNINFCVNEWHRWKIKKNNNHSKKRNIPLKAKDKKKNITTKEETKITYTKRRFRVTLSRWKKGWTTPQYLSIFIADNVVMKTMVKNTVALPAANFNSQFPVPLISSSKHKVNNELSITPTPRSIHDWTRIRKFYTLLLSWDDFQNVRIVTKFRHNVERVTQAIIWLNSWQTIFNLWISAVRFISSALIYAKGIYDVPSCKILHVPFIAWVATVYVWPISCYSSRVL